MSAKSIRLPLPGDPVRELLGDIHEVAEILSPSNRNKILVIHMAEYSAREFFRNNPSAREVYQITRSFDGEEFYFTRFTNNGVDSLGGGCISASHVWNF